MSKGREVTIKYHRHGVTVDSNKGVPVQLIGALVDAYPEYPITAIDVSQRLGVVLALTTEEGADRWMNELEMEGEEHE